MFWNPEDCPRKAAEISERVQSRLRRLFPSLEVTASPADYGNLISVGFIVDRPSDQYACGMRAYPGILAGERGCREMAGRILRTAYPKGWAQP